jgi:hypothetical protein
MWFEPGQSVGTAGRTLSGFETLFMYAVEALALLGVWRGRRQLSVWMLCAIAATGTIVLGLVVTNVGALYRLRYTFFILLIILAGGATVQILDWSRGRLCSAKRIGA